MNKIIEEDLLILDRNKKLFLKLFKSKNVLLVGASSFILSYLLIYLVLNIKTINCKLFICIRNKKEFAKKYNFLNFKDENLNIIKFNDIDKNNIKFHYIIHSASNSSPKSFQDNPISTYEPNLFWTQKLLEISEKNNSHFIFFSSGEIYGNFSKNIDPLKIDQTCNSNIFNPNAPYADSKRMAETMCMSWNKERKTKTTIIRLFHTYGPFINLNDNRIYSYIIKNIIENKSINLSNIHNKRCFCYSTDFLKAFLIILDKAKNFEILNVANNNEEYSIKHLSKKLEIEFKEKKLIFNLYNDTEFKKFNIKRAYPNIDRLKKMGWKPKIGVKEGFRKTFEYYKIETSRNS